MTKAELIQAIEYYPDDAVIYVPHWEGHRPVRFVETVKDIDGEVCGVDLTT
jgi:hypothetical protein